MAKLYPRWTQSREVVLHVVAEIIESQFVVGAVGDIGGVGDFAFFVGQRMLDAIDGKTERPVDLAHPLGIASGQVIIDRDDVNALAFQGVEVGRKSRDQRFPFTGLHLRDAPPVQDDSADKLHVEVAHVQGSFGDFPHGGKCFRENVVQGFPVGEALAEFRRQLRQLHIGAARHLRLPAR